MSNDGYDVYKYWLAHSKAVAADREKAAVREEVETSLKDSAAYQSGAKRNGEQQPIVAARTSMNICRLTVMPGDEMFVGDLIEAFNEKWLCMELYEDEYGVKYGEMWMCNHEFVFQDHDGKIIQKAGIFDDGSYSKSSDKAIPIVDGTYRCYMSLDDESRSLYVDKRIAIDVILDRHGKEILDVGKIKWIDQKTKNYGTGSHMLFFTLVDDVYNEEKDRIDLLLCDYINTEQQDDEPEPPEGGEPTIIPTNYLVISGRDSIRIGTSRTYKASAVDAEGNSQTVDGTTLLWTLIGDEKISIEVNGTECRLQIPLSDELIGKNVQLKCEDTAGLYQTTNKEVAVISIG